MRKLFTCIVFVLSLAACNSDDGIIGGNKPNNNTEETYTVDAHIESLSSILFGTSWRYQYRNQYYSDGSYERISGDDYSYTYTFTDKLYKDNKYKLLVNGEYVDGCNWYIDNDGLSYYALPYGYANGMSAFETGGWLVSGGSVDGEIRTLTSSELIVRKDYGSSGFEDLIYSKSNNNHYVGGGDDNDDDEREDCNKCFGDGVCAVCCGDGLCYDIIAGYYTCHSCGGDGICNRCNGSGKEE